MIKVDLLNLQDIYTMNLADNHLLTEAVIKDLDSSKFGNVFRVLHLVGKMRLNPLKHDFSDVSADVMAKIRASCDVCGEETEFTIQGIEKFLVKVKKKAKGSKLEHEIDLDRDELDEIFLEDGKNLDLISVLRDTIHVLTPSRIRCHEHQEFGHENADNMAGNNDVGSIPRYQSSKKDKLKGKMEAEPSPFAVLEGLKKNLKH